MVEFLPSKQVVVGSNPIARSIRGGNNMREELVFKVERKTMNEIKRLHGIDCSKEIIMMFENELKKFIAEEETEEEKA